jgi:hypothetical protein
MGYVVCGGCAAQISTDYWNSGGAAPCLVCERQVEVHVFPAAMRRVAGLAPEAVVTGEEASCYNHAMHRAVAACDSCGRFLCSLCDIPFSGMRVCPSCFESGKGAGHAANDALLGHNLHDAGGGVLRAEALERSIAGDSTRKMAVVADVGGRGIAGSSIRVADLFPCDEYAAR